MTLRSWGALAVAAVLAVGSVSACSDDSSSDSPGTGTQSGGALSGEPVQINIYYPKTGAIAFPQMTTAIRAAEKAVNDSGGINGRPLKVNECDAQSPADPNPTLTCMRKVLQDQKIVAEIGDYGSFNDIVTPLQNQAKLTQIGGVPLGTSQMELPNSYPLIMPEEQAFGAALVDSGSKRPALVYIDIPTAQKAFSEINEFLAIGRPGNQLIAKQPAPLTATDLAPQVAALCDADGVSMSVAPSQIAQWLTAHEQGPCQDQIQVTAALGLASTLPTLGAKAEGLVVVSGLPFPSDTSLEGVKMFNEQMDAIDSSAGKDMVSMHTWLAVWAFAQEARKMQGEITRASVADHWSKIGDFQVFDLLPPGMNLQKGLTQLEGNARLTNHWFRMGTVKNGAVEESGKGWIDSLSTS